MKIKKPPTVYQKLKKSSVSNIICGEFSHVMLVGSDIGRFCKKNGFKLVSVEAPDVITFPDARCDMHYYDNAKILAFRLIFKKL